MFSFSENVIDEFSFKGGDVNDLAEKLEKSLKLNNNDWELVKYYDEPILHHLEISVKNISLTKLVEVINRAVRYDILMIESDGRLVLRGKTKHFYLVATRTFELPNQIYITSLGNKVKLEETLSNLGILFNKEEGAKVVKISSEKPYVATIRNNTDELDLIDSLLTLLARVQNVPK